MWSMIPNGPRSQCSKRVHGDYRKVLKYSDTQQICRNHSKIWTKWLYHRVMSPNDADGMANSADPDQTAPRSSLIRVCTVCLGISVRKLRISTVYSVSSQYARGKSSLVWKPEVYPICFNGTKTFKNVTLQILNFILINNKNLPIWCNVNFVSVFTALSNTEKQRNFNITPYGEMFYQLTYWDKI